MQNLTWPDLKVYLALPSNAKSSYTTVSSSYLIFTKNSFEFITYVPLDGGTFQLDFETNYKDTIIVLDPGPTSTVTSVASSATNVTLLAENINRKFFSLSNDSNQDVYVKFGATATSSSFTIKMAKKSGTQLAYYESPNNCYTGKIDAIWDSANGSMRITEIT